MVATRTAARGLSTDQLTTIRDSLAAGRKPKVTFTASAGQIAGQTGQVVALTDPQMSDDWVVVRFGHDELPFSPADLAVTGRARRGGGAAGRRAPDPAPPPPEFMIAGPPAPAPRHRSARAPAPASPASAAPASADAAMINGPSSAVGSPTANDSPAPSRPAPGGSAGSGSAAKPARKATRPKGPAGLTVTLAYGDGEWTLAAQQGSKALAKPYAIKPAEALKIVSLVDVPGVHEAVEQIMAAERAQAESQAEKLRAELADIEARLAELREV
jgi:hypothetical protein